MSTEHGPFEQVYDAHAVGIYRFIYARVGNRPDAEDLTAQVFVRAVEQLEQLRALEYGHRLRVVETDLVSVGVDTPADLDRVRGLAQALVK